MDPAEERRAVIESAMQLLWKELDNHLEHCMSGENEPKEVDLVQGGERKYSSENEICLKEKELEKRESEIAAMERALLEKQNALDAKEKMLEQRSLDLDAKESDLVIRERNLSEVEEMNKRMYEVNLRERKPEEKPEKEIELRSVRANVIIEGSQAKPDFPTRSDSDEKMKGSDRKRNRKVLEMGEGSTGPQSSDLGIPSNVQGQDGLSFVLTMLPTHENDSAMTVPSHFVTAFDLSRKKYVILSTDEGKFRIMVKHYDDPRLASATYQRVVFRRGWSYFYYKNRLSVGMQCLFRVKEHTVNGDDSTFSMEVTVLGR